MKALQNVVHLRIGFPSLYWTEKRGSCGPSDFTSLYFRAASPARISTVRVFRRSMRAITSGDTPIVAALAV